MSDNDDFPIDLKAASIMLRMPQHTVLKCIRYIPRPNGGIRLSCKDKRGNPFFREVDLTAFLADLKKPWMDNPKEPRPEIPTYFQEALKLEVGLKCGLCGTQFAAEFAHVIPYEECHHHHPWNILSLCVRCHKGYDREKRITQDEIQRAKERAQATFLEQLEYCISEEKCLHRLRSIIVPVNNSVASGIDLLISTLCSDAEYLHISKPRVVEMLSQIGDGTMNANPILTMLRLTELSAAHLSESRVGAPFWNELAEWIYERNFFPEITIALGPAGVRMLEHLQENAHEFVDVTKFPRLGVHKPVEAIKALSARCQKREHNLHADFDKLENMELNSFDLW